MTTLAAVLSPPLGSSLDVDSVAAFVGPATGSEVISDVGRGVGFVALVIGSKLEAEVGGDIELVLVVVETLRVSVMLNF